MCCVGNDNDVRAVTLGADGAFAGMTSGAVFVDHTTASAEVARIWKRQRKAGFKFVDAPVSGGQACAENGTLYGHVRRSADAYSDTESDHRPAMRGCQAVGPRGLRAADQNGQSDLHCRPGGKASRKAFISPKNQASIETVVDTISKGAAQSWQMDNRDKAMDEGRFDFGFAVEWMCKDLSICLAEARGNGANCRSPRWSISFMPRSRRWAARAGTRPA